MNRMPEVLVAGHGQMGRAMQALLGARSALKVWDVSPADTVPPAVILAAAARADILLLCVPTPALAGVLGPLAGQLPGSCGVLSVAKGLDEEGRTAAELLAGRRGTAPWGVLGGPMIADELAAGAPGFAELGTPDAALYVRATTLFGGSGLKLTHTREARAVSWCGVLKNVYAPLVGVVDGLGLGHNARGHLMMAALTEMQALLAVLAGGAGAYGDAGLADFIATAGSSSSHHHALGLRVARSDFTRMECEGTHSLSVLMAKPRFAAQDYPLFRIATGLVQAPAGVPAALRGWLAMP